MAAASLLILRNDAAKNGSYFLNKTSACWAVGDTPLLDQVGCSPRAMTTLPVRTVSMISY